MHRLLQQLEFIKEIDKLKSVLRRSLLINGERYENSAEHSWHFAIMAMVLAEHYQHKSSLDMLRVIKMALIHDLAEIYAGDTYCYDEISSINQHQREFEAINKLFSHLPTDMRDDLFALWDEFETGLSHESKFARVIDRLNPFMLNFYSGGVSWIKHQVKKSQVLKRMGEIKDTCPNIWSYVCQLLETAIEKGWIRDDSENSSLSISAH
jgi:putative hydrolases of HD superfamily